MAINKSGWFAFAPDGQSVYMADSFSNKVYQVPVKAEGDKPVERKLLLTGPDNVVYTGPLAASQDGSLVAVMNADYDEVDLFDVKAGKLQNTFKGDYDGVVLAFNLDGSLLLSSSPDGVRVWDTKAGKQMITLPVKAALTVAFNSTNTVLALAMAQPSANAPANIELWGVPAQ